MADEAIEVTVALRRGARRRPVQLQVSPDDTLAQVVDRAAARLGIPGDVPAAFHDPERNAIGRTSDTVTLVDSDGRATWMHPFAEVTYRQLLESAEAGVLEGDPRRLYLDTKPGIGNGPVPDWETIKAIWDALDFVLGAIGAVTTLNEARKRLAARLRRSAQDASQAIEQHSGDWESRRGDPHVLHQWLGDRVWSSADLASALGCSEPEAGAVLWSFGFTHSPSCVWRRSEDEESKFVNEVHGLSYGVQGASQEQVRQVLEANTRRFLESGRASDIEWYDLPWLDTPLAFRVVGRAQSRLARLREWLRRMRR
jgi:hypothetical protein